MQNRFLSPRLKEFLDNEIPEKITDPTELLLKSAESCVGIMEEGSDNHGKMIEAFQATIGGACGESWCLSFVQSIIGYVEDRLGVSCDLHLTEHCLTLWDKTSKDSKFKDPIPGDLVLWRYGETTKGHVGIVLKNDFKVISTAEGNTGPGGIVERNGDGVYKKIRAKIGTSNMHLLGYIRINYLPTEY